MGSHRKSLTAFLLVVMPALAQPLLAQNYPTKPIRFIVASRPAVRTTSSREMTSHLKAELVKWARVVKDAKLSPGTLQ